MHARVLLACNACCNVESIGIMGGEGVGGGRRGGDARGRAALLLISHT